MRYDKRFIVKPGSKVRLSKCDPGATPGQPDKESAEAALAGQLSQLSKLQYLLFAENKRALLIVLQAMDSGGKDGTVRHVVSAMNPQGCRVTPFKAPTAEELAHDFLWRIHQAVPPRGQVGVFNRSHYEDVLVVRVHDLVPREVWSRRYDEINDFERLLAGGGVHLLKFFLHVSKEEQLARLKSRLVEPHKQWKVNPADFEERKYWDAYMNAYEEALSRCSTAAAPWFVIPADRKWFRNLAVAQIIVETLERLEMKFPRPTADLSKIKAR